MIAKERDATERTVAALERRALRADDELTKSACRGAAERLRADPTTAAACAFVDRFFAEAEDWSVIHDLRLRVGTHAVQLNHVLIGDALEIVCLDTRFLHCGLRADEDGRWEMLRYGAARPIASPPAKMARDLRKLRDTLREIDFPSVRRQRRPRATMRGLVLTDPGHRLEGALGAPEDTIGVYPRDALYAMLWKRRQRRYLAPGRLAPEQLAELAAALVERHQPVYPRDALDGAHARQGDAPIVAGAA